MVDQILTREINVSKNLYKFYKTVPAGTLIKSPDRRYTEKYQPGAITLFKNPRGKGYLLCLVQADLDRLLRAARSGHSIAKVQAATLPQTLKLIPPAKARLFAPVLNQI